MRHICLILFTIASVFVHAQDCPTLPWTTTPSPKHEVRAVWLTVVQGLDWPLPGRNQEQQKQDLIHTLDQLQQAGINLTEEDVFSRAPNTVSRAHVADALKAKGLAQTRQDGFRKYLLPGCVGYVPSAGVSAVEAIQHIKHAGGLAVIAHPGLVANDWNFPTWTQAGLDGIEVFYPAHTYALKQDLLALARKYGLFCTGGSDYHGPHGGRIKTAGVSIPQPHYDKLLHALFTV